jgi:hypothetical protein
VSQFRTTADILDEVLRKAGEPTNGSSPWETPALTYLNKVHHAIIAGGSIFNVDVDEPWVWARSKHPIVLELEPAYTTGAITMTVNDINGTLTVAPTASLEGWHFQVNGKPTVYKIMKHTAGDTTIVLDSSFVNDTGAYLFRAFKLDYEITPAYLYIDSSNDKLDFKEEAVTLTASMTHGAYTPSNLVAHAVAQLNSPGTATWTGAYDSVLRQISITASVTAGMLGVSGNNKLRSTMTILGLDSLDYTAATSFTSSYASNSVSRLIEPLKIFSGETTEPFIRSTDPIKMQEDYPMSMCEQRVPERFCRISEDNTGTLVIRFSSYPQFKMKAILDWIPVPRDLQDNAASYPRIPRTDVDVLIHGAAAYIAFDKEDSKFDTLMKLVNTGLQAMQKKNRSLLNRTGEYFAQIIPRTDLAANAKRLNYGYTVSGSSTANISAESVQSMIAVTMSFSTFMTASTVATVTARTLPSNRTLFALIAKHETAFAGTAISDVKIDVGIAGDPTKFINQFDVDQAVSASAQDSSLVLYYPALDTDIQVRMTSVGANLSALTNGSLVLYFSEVIT